MADVFISHHTKTALGIAQAIAEDLERHGVSCWYAPRDVTAGAYSRSIVEAIDACKIFLLILNEPATRSEHVLSELNIAFGRFNRHEAIALLPIRVDGCHLSSEMRYYLGPLHITEMPSVPGKVPVGKITELVSGVLKNFAAQSQPEQNGAEMDSEHLQENGLRFAQQPNDAPSAPTGDTHGVLVRVISALLVAVIVIFVLLLSNGRVHLMGRLSPPSEESSENTSAEGEGSDGRQGAATGEEASDDTQGAATGEEASDDTQGAATGEEASDDTGHTDTQTTFIYEGQEIPVYDIPKRQVHSGDFVWQNARLRYVGDQFDALLGVDVSSYQNRDRANGALNWEAAKADGVEFAIVRVGFRGTSTGVLREDNYYARNIDSAMSAGLITGAYIFSSAISVKEALEEADFVIDRLREHPINGPVAYNWEVYNSNYRNFSVSKATATQCAKAFCERVKEAGYTPMIYMSRYVGYTKYDLSQLPYLKWYPQYAQGANTKPYPNFLYWVDVWQFSDSASVAGIGTNVYANLWFRAKVSESAES